MLVKGSTAIAGTLALVLAGGFGTATACGVGEASTTVGTAKASSIFEELPISTMKV